MADINSGQLEIEYLIELVNYFKYREIDHIYNYVRPISYNFLCKNW